MRAYRIAYDGREYHGFQRQPDVPTVADAILDAMVSLDLLDAGGGGRTRPVPEGYAAAGRTDAGVSALRQTVAIEAPDWLTPAALNAELPDDVWAWAHADVPEEFHATHDATERRYRYYLHAPGADRDAAREAVERLAGEHDFQNLTPDESGTRRTLAVDLTVDRPFLVLDLAADGFPRQLVRRVATLVELVASGERPPSFVDRALSSEPLSGPEGIAPAAPEPLVLVDVAYPDVEWAVDDDAARDARSAFAERRIAARTRARVAGDVADGIGSG